MACNNLWHVGIEPDFRAWQSDYRSARQLVDACNGELPCLKRYHLNAGAFRKCNACKHELKLDAVPESDHTDYLMWKKCGEPDLDKILIPHEERFEGPKLSKKQEEEMTHVGIGLAIVGAVLLLVVIGYGIKNHRKLRAALRKRG